LALPALIASFGCLTIIRTSTRRIDAWLTLALAWFVFFVPLWDLDVSAYKALPQVEAYPHAERVAKNQAR